MEEIHKNSVKYKKGITKISPLRKIERLFSVLSDKIRNQLVVSTETFESKLDGWLNNVLNEPKIDNYALWGSCKQQHFETSRICGGCHAFLLASKFVTCHLQEIITSWGQFTIQYLQYIMVDTFPLVFWGNLSVWEHIYPTLCQVCSIDCFDGDNLPLDHCNIFQEEKHSM